MSSIKLTADTGGGTFELKAPSSGSNARVLTVPDSVDGTILTTTNPNKYYYISCSNWNDSFYYAFIIK